MASPQIPRKPPKGEPRKVDEQPRKRPRDGAAPKRPAAKPGPAQKPVYSDWAAI